MKKRILAILLSLLIPGGSLRAGPAKGVHEITVALADIEQAMRAHSPEYKAASAGEDAAYYRARAALPDALPSLSIEGYYRYNSVVPALSLIPGAPPRELTDNENYSIGPSVQWVLWDGFAGRSRYQGLKQEYKAEIQHRMLIERTLLLEARTAYAAAALAADTTALIAEALSLARAQYRDIQVNVRAGAKSRMDELASHQELLRRMKDFRQARTEMAASLRDLYAIAGMSEACDLRSPCDARALDAVPAESAKVSAAVSLEPMEELLPRFGADLDKPFSDDQPGVRGYTEKAAAAEFSLRAARARYFPRITVSAHTSIDYPNGPVRESFNQHFAGAVLSWPIFEFNRTGNAAREAESTKQALLYNEEQALINARVQWEKAHDQYANLVERKTIEARSLAESQELAGIVYKAYQAGSATYLEVENANFRALEARMALVRTNAQLFTTLAILASFFGEE